MSSPVSTPIRTTLPLGSVTYWRNQIRALFVASYWTIWSQQKVTFGLPVTLGNTENGSFGVRAEVCSVGNAANQFPVANRSPLSASAAEGSQTVDFCPDATSPSARLRRTRIFPPPPVDTPLTSVPTPEGR